MNRGRHRAELVDLGSVHQRRADSEIAECRGDDYAVLGAEVDQAAAEIDAVAHWPNATIGTFDDRYRTPVASDAQWHGTKPLAR